MCSRAEDLLLLNKGTSYLLINGVLVTLPSSVFLDSLNVQSDVTTVCVCV